MVGLVDADFGVGKLINVVQILLRIVVIDFQGLESVSISMNSDT